ncbi:hypothetical protein COCC4DRAFT_62362 [Bipolaris maydis ATCC 48331]|uniref:Microbial-type PARG catalytic domain-containing protein n=3 Tax=Cochliobolus heterostrophus TaxID=5016 RepID=M2THH6_COCH5|nr:uncharacterized protein COCC4DRAFT_62362 [Bipolaris maydis ATCC 48331]EMD96865.1 hypothetical protein COCHEDRAFT_1086942 [Bipolaris maydis C5]KAJ5052958.1 hypothetical protein J3E74DRAFT_229104 [Bipolaris maydis]ENI03734.1 hypothetical protein COCC4DRAFT_62362 [Bipolaris maydis ATCC 48331]KAJ6201485.1 hypothetical protein J3E72DRAFT_180395 [Bipolaris maydis]KAJ6211500.1 hypothetical protein PSV09DRAFT_1086942 [Bipolaris maydis]
MDLAKVADETKAVLPDILADIPNFDATKSSLNKLDDTDALSPADCPGFKSKASIKVLDMDSFDAALHLDPTYTVQKHLTSSPPNSVLVLNLASERSPGGGWQKGALAQEECLCYRSSLSLSLSRSFYPLPTLSAIYTPNVVLFRDSMPNGHALFPTAQLQDASSLPAVSVVSAAALRKPALSDDKATFKQLGARAATKRKIRLVLRIAARNGHSRLVLGALGCGVFANPAEDVAQCFAEVFDEAEFQGGWWEEVVFAVLDNVSSASGEGGQNGSGNFGMFYRGLHGKVV